MLNCHPDRLLLDFPERRLPNRSLACVQNGKARMIRDSTVWLRQFVCDRNLRACALVSLIFVCMPPEGIPGLEICLYQRMTHAPCPGCGMTRCGSNLVRGHLVRAFQYNPVGVLIVLLIFSMGCLGIVPKVWREFIRDKLVARSPGIRAMYLTIVAAFVAFGVIRWIGVYNGWLRFPAAWLGSFVWEN